KQHLAERVHGRHEGSREDHPPGDKTGNLTPSDSAARRSRPPKPLHTSEIEPQRYCKNRGHRPLRLPHPLLVPCDMMSEGGLRPTEAAATDEGQSPPAGRIPQR